MLTRNVGLALALCELLVEVFKVTVTKLEVAFILLELLLEIELIVVVVDFAVDIKVE